MHINTHFEPLYGMNAMLFDDERCESACSTVLVHCLVKSIRESTRYSGLYVNSQNIRKTYIEYVYPAMTFIHQAQSRSIKIRIRMGGVGEFVES